MCILLCVALFWEGAITCTNWWAVLSLFVLFCLCIAPCCSIFDKVAFQLSLFPVNVRYIMHISRALLYTNLIWYCYSSLLHILIKVSKRMTTTWLMHQKYSPEIHLFFSLQDLKEVILTTMCLGITLTARPCFYSPSTHLSLCLWSLKFSATPLDFLKCIILCIRF